MDYRIKLILTYLTIAAFFAPTAFDIFTSIFVAISVPILIDLILSEPDKRSWVKLDIESEFLANVYLITRNWHLAEKVTAYTGRGVEWINVETGKPAKSRAAMHCAKLWYDEIKKREYILSVLRNPVSIDDPSPTWMMWQGGEMPVPEGTDVFVKWRSGHIKRSKAGEEYARRWRHLMEKDDIVAYRLAKEGE